MNDHRIQQRLPAILVTILSILFAIYAGSVIGTGQTRTLMMIAAGAGFIALGLFFRASIWLLIPFFWGMSGKLPFLPLPFSVRDLGILVALAWFLIFIAVRIVRTKAKFDLLDFILLLNLCSLLFAYIRNPVGTLATGSDLIGGRPYLDTAIAVGAYFVLTHAKLSPQLASRLPYVILVPAILMAFVGLATYLSPGAGNIIARFYSGFAVTGEAADMTTEMVRLAFLSGCGYLLFLYLISRYPLRSFANPLNPIRSFLLGLSLVCVLLSGFRSLLMNCAVAGMIVPFYKRTKRDALWLLAGGVVAVGVLSSIQGNAVNLPLSIQRTLSFLPGRWSNEAISDGVGSTEWRLYMWKAMLEDDKYLQNPFLGDGFGFSQRLFNASMAAQDMKREYATQEHFLITGGVHSGPLSTIRYVGFLGLALYLWLSITLAIRAHRLLKQSRSTPFSLVTMFLMIPIITHPFFFVFIFGGFDSDFPKIIYWIGLFKLLESSLQRYLGQKEKKTAPEQVVPKTVLLPGLPRLIDLRPPIFQR